MKDNELQFNDGTTALHVAVWLGSLSRFKEGLNKNAGDFNKADMRGFTPLYYAVITISSSNQA